MVPGNVYYCERVEGGGRLGPDSIINEMLKYGGSRMVEVLYSLVNLVMESKLAK